MALSRRGTGAAADLRALASQIHPVFMLPPVASSLFGAALSGRFAVGLALLHATSAFFALYTAHVKDGYVDFYGRGEDDDHPLTERAIWVLVGPLAAAITLPGWFIGFLHAPQFDMNPVTATIGYPSGIALALVGGYYVQAETLTPDVLAFAIVFLTILSGIKVIDDAQDYDYDRSIDKRTVAVVLGQRSARRFAFGLMVAGLAGVVAFAAVAVFPPSAVLAAVAFGAVALAAVRADPEIATMLLIRGSYVFLAVLVVAVWIEPLS
jgi:1,4-dihydroxy-2-naphthoate octaprenyltransferase